MKNSLTIRKKQGLSLTKKAKSGPTGTPASAYLHDEEHEIIRRLAYEQGANRSQLIRAGILSLTNLPEGELKTLIDQVAATDGRRNGSQA